MDAAAVVSQAVGGLAGRAAEGCASTHISVSAVIGTPPTQDVMREYGDIRLAFGESDEYSFVFHKDTKLYGALPGQRPAGWLVRQLPACRPARLPSTTHTHAGWLQGGGNASLCPSSPPVSLAATCAAGRSTSLACSCS